MPSRLPRCAFPLAALVVGLAGCGKPPTTEGDARQEPDRTYVGKLDGGPDSARIGIVTQGDRLLAYVCSGEEAFNGGNCRWLSGRLSSGAAELTHAGGMKLSVEVKG